MKKILKMSFVLGMISGCSQTHVSMPVMRGVTETLPAQDAPKDHIFIHEKRLSKSGNKGCFSASAVQKVVQAKGRLIKWKGRRFALTQDSTPTHSFTLSKGVRLDAVGTNAASPGKSIVCQYDLLDVDRKVLGRVTLKEVK